MRVFENQPGEWNSKHNFVDENNVVIGYDSSQSCCEDAGYYWTETEPTKYAPEINVSPSSERLAAYRFDAEWFRQLENVASEPDGYPPLDNGGAVAFRLTAPDQTDLFLVLYNAHNGYYGHGFTVEVGGKEVRSGNL